MTTQNEIFTIDNEKLLNILENFKNHINTDDINIQNTLNILNKIISSDSKNDINLNYEDVIRVLKDKKYSYIIKLEAKSHKEIESLVKCTMQDMMIENNMKDKIKGVLLSFNIHPDYSLSNLSKIIDLIMENTNDDTDIIFGTKNDENIYKENIEIIAIISHTIIRHLSVNTHSYGL